MAEIDAEVRRRRASGDLPAGLERELDELFLEFSPVGLQGRARLRETLSLVDGSAYVDIAVPTASNKAVGSYVKRAVRKGLGWYMNFIVAQIVKFAWSVSRMFHVVVDHIEDLEAAVEAHRTPDLPASVTPSASDGGSWWAAAAVEALAGVTERVVVADCGDASLVESLLAAERGRLRGGPVGPRPRAGPRPRGRRAGRAGPRPPRRGGRRGAGRHRADGLRPMAAAQRARTPARPGVVPTGRRRDPGAALGLARRMGRLRPARGPGPRAGAPAPPRDLGPPARRAGLRRHGHRDRGRRPATGPRRRGSTRTPPPSTPPSTPSTTSCSVRRSTSWSPRGSGDRRPPVRPRPPAPGRHRGPHPRPAGRVAGGRLGVRHLRRGGPRRAPGRGHLLRGVPVPGPARRRAPLPARHVVAGGRLPARPGRAAGARLPQRDPGVLLRGLGGAHGRRRWRWPASRWPPWPPVRCSASPTRPSTPRELEELGCPATAVVPILVDLQTAHGAVGRRRARRGWPPTTGTPRCSCSSGGSRPTSATSAWSRRCGSTAASTTPTPGSTWWDRRSPRPTPRRSSPSPTSWGWRTRCATPRG